MARFQISHTTLREAYQTLTAKGMIAAKAKVGTRVLDERHWNMFDADILAWRLEVGIPTNFLAMLLEIRQSLEPVAAALAAERRRDTDVARLRQLVSKMRDAGGNRNSFVEADVAFHQCILEVSYNSFMFSLAALIRTALAASLTLSAPTKHPRLTSLIWRQHVEIVDAIEVGDAQGASDAMSAVIKLGWQNFSGSTAFVLGSLEISSFMTVSDVTFRQML